MESAMLTTRPKKVLDDSIQSECPVGEAKQVAANFLSVVSQSDTPRSRAIEYKSDPSDIGWSESRTESSILSVAARQFRGSQTIAIAKQCAELEASGARVIRLSGGEPDFSTPDHICRAAETAIRNRQTGYISTSGLKELRQAISDKFRDEKKLSYSPEEIIVGCGAKQVLFNSLAVTMDQDSEVILPAPFWVSFPEMVQICGGRSMIVECSAKKRWKIQPDQLDAAITHKTKWLVLNSPNNPTGAVYSRDELSELASVLMNHPHVMILSDDIYEDLTFGDSNHENIVEVEPRLSDRTLLVGGFSKSFAMTGWRVGYGAGPKVLIDGMSTLQAHSTYHTSTISQHAALAALDDNREFQNQWMDEYKLRREYVYKKINSIPSLSTQLPDGAFYFFVDCRRMLGTKYTNEIEWASDLLNHHGVAVVPGSAFGMPGYFRLSFCTSMKNLSDGLEGIRAFCESGAIHVQNTRASKTSNGDSFRHGSLK